jgi:hypothetical protein
MRRTQTPQRPLFDIMRPGFRQWQWTVTMHVASSGYITDVVVRADHGVGADQLTGLAHSEIPLGYDVAEILGELAIEACLAGCEATLPGHEPTVREFKPSRWV